MINPHPSCRTTLLAAIALMLCAGSASHAEVVLATDFAGRTVSGKTASNIIWTGNGLSAPSSLTAVDEAPTTAAFAALFDTANAQGHFAPDLNIDNEGPWSTSIPLALTVPEVLLEEVVLAWQHFNHLGAFQVAARAANWTVSVSGSASGELASVTASNVNGISGMETFVFSPPLNLTRAESYALKIFVIGTGPGNNTGLDALLINGQAGSAVPLHLDVTNDGPNLEFEWASRPGMFYVLWTSTDLAASLSSWESVNLPGAVEDNGVFQIAADPPRNRHSIPRPGDPLRFYRVQEFPLPPVVVLGPETFDATLPGNLPAGWTSGFDPADTAMNTPWQLGDPAGGPLTGPSTAHSGPHCVGTNLLDLYGIESNTWLRTPPIDLTTATAATVTFRQWVDIDDFQDLDRGTVRVLDASVLPGTVTELGVVATNLNGYNFAGWTEFSAKLPPAALGQSVALEFLFESDDFGGSDAAGWYLDDVVVTIPAR